MRLKFYAVEIPPRSHVSFNVAEKSIKAWKMNACVRQADG